MKQKEINPAFPLTDDNDGKIFYSNNTQVHIEQNQMKTAREMFEELGYERFEEEEKITYEKEEDNRLIMCIVFDLDDKVFTANLYWSSKDYETRFPQENTTITMQELQAINQMCRELGWFE